MNQAFSSPGRFRGIRPSPAWAGSEESGLLQPEQVQRNQAFSSLLDGCGKGAGNHICKEKKKCRNSTALYGTICSL
ncbi:hypothetical protein FKM82_021308 [Ascaphus truei]